MRSRCLSLLAVAVLVFGAACSSSDEESAEETGEDDEVKAATACRGKTCGASCKLCNGRPGCFETAVPKFCSATGACRPQRPACEAPSNRESCMGKTCRESCTLCNGRPGCVESAVLKSCTSDGQCVPGFPVCFGG